jgi:hypothetical protein
MLAAGTWACGDDDDGADGGTDTDTDADTDVDTDADTDTDTGSEVTYDGTLEGNVQSAGVTVATVISTDLSIGFGVNWNAVGGNVNNVTITEVRVFVEDTLYETYAGEDFDITVPWDQVVMEGIPTYASYSYQNTVQEGYHEHCNELLDFEIDTTYNEGAAIDTLIYGGESDYIQCTDE